VVRHLSTASYAGLPRGDPGHHFQIAIRQRLTDIPAFRIGSRPTAYVEGWALYAEYLAWEAGYDDDPYGDLGPAERAVPCSAVVVDTGIHARAGRESRAIAYMVEKCTPKRW
jgi:uncharacterized protein (DUF885 family)